MNKPQCWAVVPAAGVGRRMGGEVPKQYLRLGQRRIIDHSLACLIHHPGVQRLVVAIGEHDVWWEKTEFSRHPRVLRVAGGEQRCHSVLNALQALHGLAAADDWVLVHDAARPCLRVADLTALLARLDSHPVGGLLGVPVHDTMKRSNGTGEVLRTVARENLWRAFTPQMFRFSLLHAALGRAVQSGAWVTDEASAMELAGKIPLMVEGHADNIKITRPEDLALAGFYLAQQQELASC
jgi:2-C-methyl-D-erythritol 4-phosphate cytidylyltransferase